MSENPDMHEEIYATYCAKMGHPSRPHFSALVTNIEQKMDFRWQFVDCNSGKPIDATNTENVCLKIKASNATFWRAVNASGQYSDWASFKPSIDLDTTIVPWSLSCGNGTKEVCVQVQDQDVVAFPICQSIVLAKPPDSFKVELFSDEAMTKPLPDCAGRQAASEVRRFMRHSGDDGCGGGRPRCARVASGSRTGDGPAGFRRVRTGGTGPTRRDPGRAGPRTSRGPAHGRIAPQSPPMPATSGSSRTATVPSRRTPPTVRTTR